MPTQNQYQQALVGLEGGLDFVTPKLTVPSGRMTDCYNFEVADRLGYKRIDGVEPFDGRESPSLAYSNTIFIEYALVGMFSVLPTIGQYIKFSDGKAPGLGFVAKTYELGFPERNFMAVVITDFQQLYQLQAGSALSTIDGSNEYSVVDVVGMSEFSNLSVNLNTDSKQFDEYVNLYDNLDNEVTSLPAGRKIGSTVTYNPATSMKWYKDRLYITQDADQLAFDNASEQIYPNDILDDGAGNSFRVLDTRLLEGSYGESDGAGILLVIKITGSFPSTTTSTTITRNGTGLSSVDIASTLLAASYYEPWFGTLWRSKNITQAGMVYTDQGWESVDMGYVFDYKEGEAYGSPAAPPPLPGRELTAVEVPVNTTSPDLAFVSGTTPNLGTIWTLQGGAIDIADAVLAGDGTKFIRSTISSNYGPSFVTTVTMSTVDMEEIPEDAVLLGLELTLRARATPTNGPTRDQRIQAKLSTNLSVTKFSNALTGSFATYTIGGANDLWGSTDLTMEDLRDSSLSVQLAPTYKGNTPGLDGYTTDIDLVSLKIYYQITVSQLFFWDGTNDATGTLVNYSTDNENGLQAWTDGDAKGQMHVKNIIAVSGDKTYIAGGDEVRTAAGGLGSLVAVVDTDMVYAGVPSLEAILGEEGRGQIIVSNFYGIEDWEAMYAVTGAGRAWTYDDFYFRYLYTGLPLSKDKPRHVEFFKHHLCLGYASGNVTMSVAGEPTNFSGTDGAASFDLGDRVTGLARMEGDTLGVFCEGSIQAISGANADDFTTTTLSPYEGAIEYTVVDAGRPIYCSYSGINTFDQTAAYGNFLGSRMSASIAPWLLPRLAGKSPALYFRRARTQQNAAIGNRPVCAVARRSKNQYRLWFEDGYVLTMTLFGNEQSPVFTMHRLFDGDTRYDASNPLVPVCHHTTVDSLGRERVHISSYSPIDNSALKRFCYELDKGWLFRNGSSNNKIHGDFTLTHNFFDTPFDYNSLRKIRVHGMTKGRGQYKVSGSQNYTDTFPDSLSDTRWQPISLPREVTMAEFGPGDYYPVTDIVDHACSGYNISLKFREMPVNQPPVIFQTLMLQYTQGKGDV